MKGYIHGLKDCMAKYKLDQVNCYRHTLAVTYDYVRKGAGSLYLMYAKLYDSFSILTCNSGIRNFEKELGIRCEKKSINGDLIESIKYLIDKGYPVVVPGNLNVLFYSRYYKKKDSWHLFLVRGYDDEKELLTYMDNMHLPNLDKGNPYVDFPIPYNDMINVFNKFNEPEDKYIFYLEATDRSKTKEEIIINFLHLYYNQFIKKLYTEKKWVELYKKCIKLNKNMNEVTIEFKNAMLNIPKYKAVTLELLIGCMNEYGYNIENLSKIKDKLSKLWMQDNLMFIKSFLKNVTEESTFTEREETAFYQEKLMEEILKCIEFLSNIKSNVKSIVKDSASFVCENNEDELVSYIDDKYIFDLKTGDTYNSWLEDSCPKVIVSNKLENVDMFSFRVKCSVIEDYKLFGHEHGIFIRTHNNMYTFGLDSDYKYVVNWIGEYLIESFENNELSGDKILFLNNKNNNIEVGYVKENKVFKLGNFSVNDKILEVGIFCKTWSECNKIKVAFSDIKLDLNKVVNNNRD